MKAHFALSAALLCAAAIPAPAAAARQPRPDTRAIANAIRALEDRWNEDWAHHDASRLAAHYTADAVLMAGGMRANGIAEIRAALTQMLSDPATDLRFHATRVDVAASGDLAYTQGTYTLRLTNPQTHQPIEDHGSYVTTYRRQADGSWKAVDDIAASEAVPN